MSRKLYFLNVHKNDVNVDIIKKITDEGIKYAFNGSLFLPNRDQLKHSSKKVIKSTLAELDSETSKLKEKDILNRIIFNDFNSHGFKRLVDMLKIHDKKLVLSRLYDQQLVNVRGVFNHPLIRDIAEKTIKGKLNLEDPLTYDSYKKLINRLLDYNQERLTIPVFHNNIKLKDNELDQDIHLLRNNLRDSQYSYIPEREASIRKLNTKVTNQMSAYKNFRDYVLGIEMLEPSFFDDIREKYDIKDNTFDNLDMKIYLQDNFLSKNYVPRKVEKKVMEEDQQLSFLEGVPFERNAEDWNKNRNLREEFKQGRKKI